jgi:hypothetical protein
MYDWGYFDQIYCISNTRNYTKRTEVRYMTRKIGMKVEFNISRITTKKEILQAHMNVINEAKSKKYERIIILEDNISKIDISEKSLQNIVNFLKENEWNLFYFGSLPDTRIDKSCSNKNNKFYKTRNIARHAYAINNIQNTPDMGYTGFPIQQLYRDGMSLISYGYLPVQFYNEKYPSFITDVITMYAYYIGINIHHPIYYILIVMIIYYYIMKNKDGLLEGTDF